jgi:hypothetical protein
MNEDKHTHTLLIQWILLNAPLFKKRVMFVLNTLIIKGIVASNLCKIFSRLL